MAGPPILLTATPGAGSATVTWLAPLDDGGAAVTGYEVRVVDAGTGTQVGVRPAAAGDTSLVVDGLTNGTAYQLQVRALNRAGAGAYSALSDSVTPATVPGAPNIGDASAGDGSATVRWTAPGDNGGSAVTGYEVRVVDATSGAPVGALRPAGRDATSLVVNGLTNGGRYRFQVRALNEVGAGQLSSLSAIVRPSGSPGRPLIGTASANGLRATVRWHAPSSEGGARIQGYGVTALRMRPNGGVASRLESRLLPRDSRSTVLRLSRGRYRFVVVARNANGDSPPSARSNGVRLG